MVFGRYCKLRRAAQAACPPDFAAFAGYLRQKALSFRRKMLIMPSSAG